MFGNHRQNARVSYATVFTARRYASAVYAVVACPSVRSYSVRPSVTKTAKRRPTVSNKA